MEFYVPTETGEFLAFCGALAALLFGLVGLFAPRSSLKFNGLQLRDGTAEGYAAARSLGGFHAGLALSAVMVAQDWAYLAVGSAFALAAFGRVLSMMSDASFSMKNLALLVAQLVLAALPLAYVFGLV
ncbi:hypothetical protein J2Y48_000805 [Mycoplana sp. BE70]|uniref:AGROH133_08824 family phage infection protein n=1 Tax=Mycoplana sp. BE70 TaxID=2817775 RepID=UPI002857561E|nr:DUF4345 family protein [Mycoplana sp. BE70]MDR6755520.1 hypothetical protein [Mycoplana sp. BE70]